MQAEITLSYGATEAKVAAKAAAKKVYPKNPPPTVANFKYGPFERNVLDFWKAASDKPTPLLFYIHGGGWIEGDKSSFSTPKNPPPGNVFDFVRLGFVAVTINYRLGPAGSLYTDDGVCELLDFAPRLPAGLGVNAPIEVHRLLRPLQGAPRIVARA